MRTIETELLIHRLPTTIARSLYSLASREIAEKSLITDEELTQLLGASLSIKADSKIDLNNKTYFIDLLIDGDQFHANGALRIDDKISLPPNRPVRMDWTVTAERFVILRKLLKGNIGAKNIQLNEATSAIVTLSDFQIPWVSSKPLAFAHASGTLHLNLTNLSLSDQSARKKVLLNHLSMKMSSHDLSESIACEVDAEGVSLGSEKTSLNFSALIEQPFTSHGSLNRSGMTTTLKGKTEKIPILLLCDFLCLSDRILNELDALIGDQLSADVNLKLRNYSGPIFLKASGNVGHLTIGGHLTEGLLTLNQPLISYVKVTPKLHKSVLHHLVPFLGSAIQSEKPVLIAIDAEGFSLPIKNWNPAQVNIGRAMIDLGKVSFSNDGELQEILQLLHHQDIREHLTVWFTPLYLQVNHGEIHCDRMDMLIADLYPIAMWGNINLPGRKVQLTIGLTATTLARAFHVKGILSDAMLQLPLKGTIPNIRLDTKQASNKISMLIAKNKNTPHGLLIGGILDILGTGDKKPPPPTTNPLPWKTDHEEETHPILAPLSLPIKTIEKGAKEIFKLFK